MKKTQITSLTLATVMLASSCASSYQAAGGVTGAMIGSHVGEAVGFLSGHGPFRGSNAALGSLVGMGVGAALGVGITSQIEKNESNRQAGRRKDATADRQRQVDTNQQSVYTRETNASFSNSTSLSELTYMDVTGDGAISKDETIEVEGYVTNTSDVVLNDIVICLTITDTKNFTVSPPLTTTLQPGQCIRYTGRVHCKKARRNQSVGVCLTTTLANQINRTESLYIPTK